MDQLAGLAVLEQISFEYMGLSFDAHSPSHANDTDGAEFR
jgi:hypothetical protein